MSQRIIILFLAGILLSAAQSVAESVDNTVLVTLRLVKMHSASQSVPVSLSFPASCTDCVAVHAPEYERQNEKEIILAFRIPKSLAIHVNVATESAMIKRVLLEETDLSFSREATGIGVEIPPQIADRVNSGEYQTHLFWRGVELRLEHGDSARKAGAYARDSFPALQRQAASNIEFGLLEAIFRLGLNSYVDDENLGRLFLMGFDTNYPHGHEDYPPHFHLALWLASYKATGSTIPHIYLSSTGSVINSTVGVYGWKDSPMGKTFSLGESFTSIDALGRPVFTITPEKDGSIGLARFDGVQCKLVPIGTGFGQGGVLNCPAFPPVSVRAEDDIEHGLITESMDGKIARQFHYDPDSGALI